MSMVIERQKIVISVIGLTMLALIVIVPMIYRNLFQTVTWTISVVDNNTRQPIQGALVSITPGVAKDNPGVPHYGIKTTDSEGKVVFHGVLSIYDYDVHISAAGYFALSALRVDVKKGNFTTVALFPLP